MEEFQDMCYGLLGRREPLWRIGMSEILGCVAKKRGVVVCREEERCCGV